MTRLRHVDTLIFQMNKIGTHQNIFSRYLQCRRSKGATYLTSGQSIKLGFNNPVLHLSHISRMACPSMTSIAMVNISIRLAQDLMVDRLKVNIRVSMTKKLYSKITNERHHSVTPEMLARKWEIGLEKVKQTLKATTQDCTALLSLTSRYRIYLI